MALPVPHASLRPGNVFETIISSLVIVVAILFVGFIVMRTGTGHLGSYDLQLRLADAGGVKVGSDVRLGGGAAQPADWPSPRIAGLRPEPTGRRALLSESR